MQVVSEKNSYILTHDFEIDDIETFIEKIIYFVSVSGIPQDNWLTKQEVLFLVATVIIVNKNLTYTSGEAIKIYKRIYNLKRQSDIASMLRRLENKTWVRFDKAQKRITLNRLLQFNLEKHKFEINLTFNFEADRRDMATSS